MLSDYGAKVRRISALCKCFCFCDKVFTIELVSPFLCLMVQRYELLRHTTKHFLSCVFDNYTFNKFLTMQLQKAVSLHKIQLKNF